MKETTKERIERARRYVALIEEENPLAKHRAERMPEPPSWLFTLAVDFAEMMVFALVIYGILRLVGHCSVL